QSLAGRAPPHPRPLHPDPRLLDEPRRGMVLPRRTPSDPPRHLHLSQRPQRQNPRLHRRLEQPRPPVQLDQDRRPDPHQGQPSEDLKRGALVEIFLNLYSIHTMWDGLGSNSRPADYEKYGPMHHAHYLNRYHGVMPPMALIAPFAQVTRSTNR